MKKLLPLFLFILVLVGLYSYLPLRREILYHAGYFKNNQVSCCSEKEILNSSGDLYAQDSKAVFNNQEINVPVQEIASSLMVPSVLGAKTTLLGEKWIEVNLSKQILTAWEGTTKFMEFKISSGKWAPTPTGTFHIWYKTRVQRMEGGDKSLGTYYNLPNVPNNMFFYMGYGIHGAYWHNNFGQPMSHGCVNEPLAEAAALFPWAGPTIPDGKNWVRADATNPGTKVVIHY